VELSGQIATFLITALTGAVLGLLFDCYRVLRTKLRFHPVITAGTDLIYWLVATVIVFIALLLGNWGELRLYVFIGLLGGALAYYRFLSKLVIIIIARSFSLLGRIVRGTYSYIFYLLKWIGIITNFVLLKPAFFILKPCSNHMKRLWQKTTRWLKSDQSGQLPK